MKKEDIRVSMSMTEYLRLKGKIAQLTSFARTIFRSRHKITPQKIEEFYEFVKESCHE